jgi:hypothetical protein
VKKLESPPYCPQANGAAERAVQTVKRAMQAWSERLTHAEFPAYLQRVLFHHRSSSSARDKTPAELVFGRRLRVPIVSSFQQGDFVNYRQTGDSPCTRAQFLMTAGRNTSWLLQDGNQLRLASNNQVAPRMLVEEEEEENTSPTHPTMTDHRRETPQRIDSAAATTGSGTAKAEDHSCRRSSRTRRQPDRFVP